MIVAMDPNFRGARLSVEQPFFARENFFSAARTSLASSRKLSGKFDNFLLQEGEITAQQGAHILIGRALGHGIEWLGREKPIVCAEASAQMQFARALTKQLGFLGINSTDQFVEKPRPGRCLILQIAFSPRTRS